VNGKWPPPGKSRQTTASAVAATATAATGTQSSDLHRAAATPARTTTSSRNESGLAARVRPARAAKRQRFPACSAQIASSANDIPSANGNAADSTMPPHTTAKVRLDQRALGPHSRQSTTANVQAASAIVATARRRIPSSAASG
jgi:hypothetical protein